MLEVAIIAALQGLVLLFIGVFLKGMKVDIQGIRVEVQLGTRQISLLQNSIHENHTDVVKLLHEHEIADLQSFAPAATVKELQQVQTRLTTLEATYKHISGRRGQNSN